MVVHTANPSEAGFSRARMTAAAVTLLTRWTGCFEAELLGLPELVGPGSVCFDVGASAGLYTVALAHLIGPSGLVYSVEPIAFAHPVWTRVLRARVGPNVRHHAVALGVEAGSEFMSVPLGRYGPVTGRSFLAWKSYGLGSNAEFSDQIAVVVDVVTLDGLSAGAGLTRLDFIKLDVEGAELHVLKGGRQTIEAFRPTMLIEIESRHTARYRYSPDDIVAWLKDLGYTMYIWKNGWRKADTVCEHTRNYLFRADAQHDACALGYEAAVTGAP